jgi:hypothetical protein
MPLIEVDHLTKTFKTYDRKEGVWGSFQNLFSREYRFVQAVGGIPIHAKLDYSIRFCLILPDYTLSKSTRIPDSVVAHPLGGPGFCHNGAGDVELRSKKLSKCRQLSQCGASFKRKIDEHKVQKIFQGHGRQGNFPRLVGQSISSVQTKAIRVTILRTHG